MNVPSDEQLVFNIVWTGTVFTSLRFFVASQMAHSGARFRFVANGCPPDQVELMERFRERHPERVVEVDVVSDTMISHGPALDTVRATRDDGEWFCAIDPDIMATAPFVPTFAELLADHDAVTSGVEVWNTSNVVPPDHPGVAGEYFFDQDGFVFGSPHLALYRRSAIDATAARWGVGMGTAGPELRDDARARLHEMGHDYLVYDTGKILNTLLQGDGHRLVHRDLPQLVHVGGMSHFLSPSGYVEVDGEERPEWARHDILEVRFQANRFAARTLQAAIDGRTRPAMPEGLEPEVVERLDRLAGELVELVATYRDEV